MPIICTFSASVKIVYERSRKADIQDDYFSTWMWTSMWKILRLELACCTTCCSTHIALAVCRLLKINGRHAIVSSPVKIPQYANFLINHLVKKTNQRTNKNVPKGKMNSSNVLVYSLSSIFIWNTANCYLWGRWLEHCYLLKKAVSSHKAQETVSATTEPAQGNSIR